MKKELTLFSLAFPIFVENFLTRLMGMVNVVLLSRLSQEAVAAIGVANQYINVLNMVFSFTTFGAAVIIAQNLGAGNTRKAAETASGAIVTNIALGIFFGLLVVVLHRPLLQMMHMEGVLLRDSSLYLCIIGGLCAVQGVNLTLAVILRNYGKTRQPMLVFLLLNLLNLAGNTVVVLRPFGLPDLGIAGIAVCTVVSQAIAAVVMVVCTKRAGITFVRNAHPFRMAWSILRIGVPGIADGFGFNLMNVCFTYFVSGMGTMALAAQTYAQNYINFVQLMGYSIGQASQILVGYRCGAGDTEGAYRLAMRNMRLAVVLNVSCMVLVCLFRRPLLSVFGADAATVELVTVCFLIDLVLEVGRPMNLVISTCLRGTGDVLWGMTASICSLIFLCIPLGFIFTQVLHWGLPSVFVALCLDEWMRGGLSLFRWRTRKWENYLVVRTATSAA